MTQRLRHGSNAVKVTALVDWNAQIHAARPGLASEVDLASKTLDHVGRTIGKALQSKSSTTRFDVTLRLYHGWHKGFEVTARRKAIITAAAQADFIALSCKSNVSIRERIEFGDRLRSGLDSRIHARLDCHLPNTLRNRLDGANGTEEKMVDTAIASDIVDIAHRDPKNWIIVLGEDDDLVPPLFVAEAVVIPAGGNLLLVRNRSGDPFLKLQEIWCAT